MKKFIAAIILILLCMFVHISPVFALQPYRSRSSRVIDSNYRLNADGGGGITLCQRPADEVIFRVQGSGNSEYCAKKKYIFIRVVPLAKSEEESSENEEENQRPEYVRYPPERINLPGQPYAYYIFEKDTANMIGPLTEEKFTLHNLVAKQKIKWKSIETTKKEDSNGMTALVIYILFILFCIYVLPFLILLAVICFVIRKIRNHFRKKRQAAKAQ